MGILPEGMLCLAAFIRMERNCFSSFGADECDGVGSVSLANWVSDSEVNLSQFALAKFVNVILGDDEKGVVLVRVTMIGRWSDESEVTVTQSVVRRRFGVAKVMSGEVEGPPGGALVGEFSLRTPKWLEAMSSQRRLPLGSDRDEYQSLWCALKSPKIRWLSPWRRDEKGGW